MREENTRLNNELQDCGSLADCRTKVSDAEASLENLQDRYEQIQEYRRKGLTVDPQTGTDLQREFYKLGDFIAGDSGSWAYNRARTSLRKHANLEGAELTAEEELYKWESASLPLISMSGRGFGGKRNLKPSLSQPTKEMLKNPYHPDWKRYSGTEYRDIGAAQVTKGLRPEAKYLKGKKHGIKWTEGPATAKKTGTPQGQWGSKSDLDFAGEKASTLEPGKGGWFDLPKGSNSVVHRPDGTTVPATRIWVRNNGSGTFHGYPAE
jgi:hypothetical protein